MMRSFTHYWRNDTWDAQTDGPFRHIAGSGLTQRGVAPGDIVYPVTVRDGKLYVAGSMAVDRVVDHAEALALLGADIFASDEHALARRPYPILRLDVRVPDNVTSRLRFLPDDKAPVFSSSGHLDQQTMRGLRELTPASAGLLDEVLGTKETPADADEREILARHDIGPTTKQQLVDARRGQGKFKSDVVRVEKKCRLTGVSDPAHLRASHIKPWSLATDEERLDAYNGLVLAPHVDHLFDRGLISFADNGKLLVSPRLDSTILQAWRLPLCANVGPFHPRQRVYLAFHRSDCFKG